MQHFGRGVHDGYRRFYKESLPLTDMWYINGRVESLPLTDMRYINSWVESIVLRRKARDFYVMRTGK